MDYSFFAFISRMKNINRWALMRNSSTENVQEHSHMTSVLAHCLAVIGRDIYNADVDPDKVASAALFHDAPEIFTGDLPTPVKYYNGDIMTAYKKVEELAEKKLLTTLPAELRDSYGKLISPDSNTEKYVKAGDKLAAYIKCLEELRAGNDEFKLAAKQTKAKLKALDMQEVEYFMDNFISAFSLTLDELNYSID